MEERYIYYTVKQRSLLADEELNRYSAQGWHLVSFTIAKLRDTDYLTGDTNARDYAIYIFRSTNKDKNERISS